MALQYIDGFRGLEKALKELPKATGKSVLRRVLKKRGKPIADDAKTRVPRDEGELADSIDVSTKLSKRQKSLHRRSIDKGTVDMFVGAGPLPHAHLVEFGSVHNQPKPFLRPAWDAGKNKVLGGLENDLWDEINQAARRIASKQGILL